MEINEIRRTNLQSLVDTLGLATFAERVGRSKTQISSLTTGWRNLGEKLARDFERSLDLEEGYFDRVSNKPDNSLKLGKSPADHLGIPPKRGRRRTNRLCHGY